MTYSFELLFLKPPKGALAGPPIAYIHVKTHTSDEKGHIFITHRCDSSWELDLEINRLKHKLDVIRKKAKQNFAKADK